MTQKTPSIAEADRYASSFIKENNKTKAFKTAFPDCKIKHKSMMEKASRIHKTPEITKALTRLKKASQKNTEKKHNLSVAGIKKNLIRVAKLGLKLKKDAHGNNIPNNLSSVVSAMAEINKMDGNHAAIKQEHYGPDGGDLPTPVTIVAIDPHEAAKQYQKLIGG